MVRWYLRYGLSYRDVEGLLAERWPGGPTCTGRLTNTARSSTSCRPTGGPGRGPAVFSAAGSNRTMQQCPAGYRAPSRVSGPSSGSRGRFADERDVAYPGRFLVSPSVRNITGHHTLSTSAGMSNSTWRLSG